MAVAFDAVGPAGSPSAGVHSTVTPLSWTHILGGSANAILVAVTNAGATTSNITSVTIGASNTALTFLGIGVDTGGSLTTWYGLLNPPTGSNTVKVNFSGAPSDMLAGSVSFTGAGSFGTFFGGGSGGVSQSSMTINVTSTTTGGIVNVATAFGGQGWSAFTTTGAGGTIRLSDPNSSTFAGDMQAIGTYPSTGSSMTVGISSGAGSDEWSIAAIEVLPPPSGQAPGPPRPTPPGRRSPMAFPRRRIPIQVLTPFSTAVTATETSNAHQGCLLRVWVITGQAISPVGLNTGTFTTHASSKAIQASITTTTTGSRVYGCLEENNTNTTVAALAGTTLTDNVADPTNSACYATCKATALTGAPPGATILGSSSLFTSGSCALAEIFPGAGVVLAEDASSPASVTGLTSTALTTAVFSPPAGSLLVAAFCGEGDGVNAQTVTLSDSAGLSWTQDVFACIAASGFSGVWTAVVPAAPFAIGITSLPYLLIPPYPPRQDAANY
jgi:hypothetical protein